MLTHVIRIDESERQLLLLALAKLSVERPGWDDMCNRLAMKMDNHVPGPTFDAQRGQMYDDFRKLYLERTGEEPPPLPQLEPTT